jgi:DNA-binding MarR family transcriptional regulator
VTDQRAARLLAVALHEAGRSFRRGGEAAAGLAPLPPTELEVVRAVGDHPGIRVSDVAAALALQPSNVSTAVRALVGRGLVVREVDPGDRRAVRLRQTDQAVRDRDALEAAWAGMVGAALAELSAEQRSVLAGAGPALRALSDQLTRQLGH